MSTNCSAPTLEHLTETLVVGTGTPRLSWTVDSDDPHWHQAGYEVSLTMDGEVHTASVEGDDQNHVPWPFDALGSRQAAEVSVRVRDTEGGLSEWSVPTRFETGLLEASDFAGAMISPRGIGGLDDPAPILSTTSVIDKPVASVRLYATAQGVYVARINGTRVGDQVLAPGWSAYRHRLLYQAYDVTDLLSTGENTLEFILGNGWYRGHLGSRPPRRDLYGDRLGVLAQLEVRYADGSTETIVSDENWVARTSNIVSDDLYNGQSTDFAGAADRQERPVDILEFDKARLVAQQSPPVRVVATVAARSETVSPSGERILDFGQNVVGWVRIIARGLAAGTVVTVRHAEVLEHGELGTRPLRSAKATDEYVVAGGAAEVLEPEFTFHGFRYVQIDGIDDLALEDVTAVVISSDLVRTGWFECSDPELNRLHENVVWGMRGNFVSLPTDCPQRDERLGWTGDIQVFAPTAGFLFDTSGFLGSWLADLAAEQFEDGSVPYVVPDIYHRPDQAAAAWGDAAVVVPWVLYRRFGDAGVLRRQFDSMCRWVDRMDSLAGEDRLWTGGFQYGDWLDPSAPPDDPGAAVTSLDLVATAHLARSAELVAEAAGVIDETAAQERYARLAAETRRAFEEEYTSSSGRVIGDSQTAYALALEWDLLPDERSRVGAGDRLADLVRAAGFTIGTGFVGTPLILDALADSGHADIAYRLLLQHECPSWLYPVTMGATTIWERWDSMLPDGTINPGQMTSFNHYAFGAVADWMHRRIAGLAPGDAGYRRIVVEPVLGGGLTHATATHLTPYGEASVSWRREGERFSLTVVVPTGCSAEVRLPDGREPLEVGAGTHSWTIETLDPARADVGGAEPLTVRDAIDSPELWDRIAGSVIRHKPEWTRQDVAAKAARYFDRGIRDLPRILGRGNVMPEEVAFAEELGEILGRP